MDERLYEERRNATRPFGYWHVVDAEDPPHLSDEQGQRWKSLRDYIWRGRLGMATSHPVKCENQIEFLLSILAAMDRRTVPIEEHVTDLFVGSWDVASLWLLARRPRSYRGWVEWSLDTRGPSDPGCFSQHAQQGLHPSRLDWLPSNPIAVPMAARRVRLLSKCSPRTSGLHKGFPIDLFARRSPSCPPSS